jgi:hypothetical protein
MFAAALWLRAGLIGGGDGKAAVTKAKGDTLEDVALLGVTTQNRGWLRPLALCLPITAKNQSDDASHSNHPNVGWLRLLALCLPITATNQSNDAFHSNHPKQDGSNALE